MTPQQRHHAQVTEFEKWAAENDWDSFHRSHYDWWAFPIDRPSSHGYMWTVYAADIAELQEDQLFTNRYVRGVCLVAASWGWDVFRKNYIPDPQPAQRWHQWPVRLHKMAQSVKLFGYDELFNSLRTYAGDLMTQGETMSYNGKDLTRLFR